MKFILVLAVLAVSALAHDRLTGPASRSNDYGTLGAADAACDAAYDPNAARVPINAGESMTFTWEANHSPSYTIDATPIANTADPNAYTTLTVVTAAVDTTTVTIPDTYPTGTYTLRWTWSNYINCVDVDVTNVAMDEEAAKSKEGNSNDDDESKGASTGTVVGLAVLGVAGVAVIGGAVFVFVGGGAAAAATTGYSPAAAAPSSYAPSSYASSAPGSYAPQSAGPSSYAPSSGPSSYAAPQSYNAPKSFGAPSSYAPSSYAPNAASPYTPQSQGPPSYGNAQQWNRAPPASGRY